MSAYSMRKTIPVVIDTDFGGDPDDAIALVYALNCPELHIRAIITSDEYKKNHRALLLTRWLRSAHYTIPVFSGYDLGNTELFLLDDFIIRDDGEIPQIFGEEGIETILTELAESGGHYVSIGGLSNLRYLFDSFQKPWESIDITIMGGAINYHRAGATEHNVGLDVEAARSVFESEVKKRWILSDHTFVPELAVSNSHKLYEYFAYKNDFFHSLVQTNMNRFFQKFYPDSRMYDPLTVSSLFLPTVRFSTEKIIFPAEGSFLPSAEGRSAMVSNSADYALFWSDINAKLH